MTSGKILFTLLFLYACQSGEFYERPAPASLEFGQSMSSSSFLSSLSAGDDWVKIDSFDMGRQPLGTVSLFEVAFKNVGNLPANIKDIALIGENSDKFLLTHNCLKALASSEKCPINISYKPDTIGKMPSTMRVTFDNGEGSTIKSDLPISAAANNLAFLKFETVSVDLGNATTGGVASAFLKVIYNGTSIVVADHPILPARGVIMTDPSESSLSIDRGSETTCSEIINTDCVIKVNFRPVAQGARNGNIGLTYFNGAEVLKIEAQVSGSGVLAAQLAELSASALDFGSSIVSPATPVGQSLNVNFSGSVAADEVVVSGPSTGMFTLNSSKSTCGTTINGACSLFIEFSPTSSGNLSDSLKISYKSNGTVRTPVLVSLTGKGVGTAVLKSDVNTLAFGLQAAHKSATKYFTLTNQGQTALSSLSAITNSNPDYTASFESCAGLAASASCRIKVVFLPHTDSLSSSTLSFTYGNGKESMNMSLDMTGTGSSPLLMEGSRSIDFGNIMIGNPTLPAAITTHLGIYGTTQLTDASKFIVNPVSLSNPFGFVASSTPGTTSNCRSPLNPNTSNGCSFGVALTGNTGFTPDVTVSQAFSISYTGDGGNGSGTLSFTAKMTPRIPPTLSITAESAFKKLSVGDSQAVKFIVKNNSPYFATAFKGISTSGNSDFKVTSNGCSGGVVANGTCNIYVTFKPSNAGMAGGILSYDYHDQIQNQTVTAVLSAEGSDDVTLVAASTVIDFGTVFVGDTIATKDIVLSYYGKKNWTSSHNAAAPYTLNTSDCGDAGNCIVKFGFTPTVAGTFNTTVSLVYTPALNSPGSISFTVKGVAKLRSATLALTPVNFPKTLKGESLTQDLVLTNGGTLLASDLSVVGPSGMFALVADASSDNCSVKTSLNPGESCKIKVKFSPVKVEASSSSLDVNYNNDGVAMVMHNTLSGQGTQRIKVFAGAFQTCIINELGKALCWGRYLSVQKPQNVTPMDFGSNVEVKKIAIGDKHACVLLKTSSSDGAVTCWSNIASAQSVSLDGDAATDISAGFEHTCALLKSGKVKCWGGNSSGQIGTGVNDFGMKATSVTAGAGHTCVLLENDSMKCWGDNFYGQLGQAVDTEQMTLPSLPIDLGYFTPQSIAASSGAFTCAVSKEGQVKCFGKTVANETGVPFYGVLGHCWSRAVRNAPISQCPADLRNASGSIGYYSSDMGNNLPKVDLSTDVVEELSVGTAFSCALMADKSVKCWGLNLSGQLGIGSVSNIGTMPSQMGAGLANVKIDRDVVQVATGYEHACAVLDNNTVKCWGTALNNATGLNAFNMMTNTGISNTTIPSALPVVYSGK